MHPDTGVTAETRRRTPFLPAILLVTLLAVLLTGCSRADSRYNWPAEIAAAPAVVRQAYAFAHDHPDVLQQLPCYCGCGPIGHTSNYDCYVAGTDEAGNLIYDGHALGCSICVDITLDAERMLDDGRSLEEVRAWIDATYSPYGPSNMP